METVFSKADRKAILAFHKELAKRCTGVPIRENCPRCCMRLYCHSAPASVTEDMLDQVMGYLENDAAVAEWTQSIPGL